MSADLLEVQDLARLLPMHVAAASDGRVTSIGPTLRKVLGAASYARTLPEIVRLRRPARPDLMAALAETAGTPLRLELRVPQPVRLVGVAARTSGGGTLLDLSFGITLGEGVREWGLSMADFAPTDLAAEFLYLAEANAAALAEARRLAERLDAAHDAARRDAETDVLTGLANRRMLDQAIGRIRARGSSFALLSIDLDRFKAVNDRWGHEAGDAVLRAVAARLRGAVRRDDLVLRLGGDEFALLLRGEAGEERLLGIAQGLIRNVEQPIPVPGGDRGSAFANVSASIGVVRSSPEDRRSVADLLRMADARLYGAKRRGRGRALGATPLGSG